MSPHLFYPPYSFTGAGGSRKPAAHNKDKLVANPAIGSLAQKSVISQQAWDAKKLKTRMAEEEHSEAAKKAKFDNLVTLEGLSASEYVEMRKRNMYAISMVQHFASHVTGLYCPSSR
jgi:cupin superfamily acireductone dioxygenase involved in methionine salvage